MKLISVVIPAYNAQASLARCLDSVLAQTYPHFEVLLVNDGSADNSPAIADQYGTSDRRIRVHHQSNGGVSAARNVGLAHASGEFVCFVDSDDWVEPSYLAELISQADQHDMLVVLNHCIHQNSVSKKKWSHASVSYTASGFSSLFTHLDLLRNGFPFSKLFSMEIIRQHHIRFDQQIHYAEDCFFMLEYLQYVQQVNYLDSAAYHYIDQPGDSLSKRYNSFESEYKGFQTGVRLTQQISSQFLLSPSANRNIELWLGKFFLRPLQSFYRGSASVSRDERMAQLKKAHRPAHLTYLRELGPLKLPASIRISIALYRAGLFRVYDHYMSILFKYHRLKLAKR